MVWPRSFTQWNMGRGKELDGLGGAIGWPMSLSTMHTQWIKIWEREQVNDMVEDEASVFDFIIVGGGSAGCVLANRLSANRNTSVLLLEAGRETRNPLFKIPVFGSAIGIGNAKYDWVYTTEPDPTRNGMSQEWPRGRMLGGSSMLNGMVYVRGAAHDYDAWEVDGCAGWSWANVLPIFQKLENISVADGVHGTEGPLKIHRYARPHKLTLDFVRAHRELGYAENPDYDRSTQDGAAILLSSTSGRIRSTGVNCYLGPVRNRNNLTVTTLASVTRIVVKDRRATAVVYWHAGKKHSAFARQEIVLTAGAINSPAVLMRSGIGPAKHLRDRGIAVECDLSGVGKNLHEHPALQISVKSNTPLSRLKNQALRVPRFGFDWVWHGGGVFSTGAYEAISFVRSTNEKQHPDLQLHFSPYALERTEGGVQARTDDSFMLQVNLSYPKSRGKVRLGDKVSCFAPVIETQMFEHVDDLESLKDGLKFVQAVCESENMTSHFAGYLGPFGDIGTAAEADEFIRANAVPAYHPAGTCKMGSDNQSVVDPKLRVYHIDGLRVADASVIPRPISGNIQSCVLMIAEKAAEMIIEDSG